MFSGSLSPYLRPTAKNTVSDATLKQVDDDILECERPVLVFCPRLGANHMPVRLKPVAFGPEWLKARETLPQQYHEDLIEMFAAVVNSGSDKDYNSAATRYRQMFGEDGKNDNAGYFLFKDGFQDKSGWQERYEGPAFNFLDAFEKSKVVRVDKDPFVQNWLLFWAQAQSETVDLGALNKALEYVWVSHDPGICWSLLLQGRQNTLIPNALAQPMLAEPGGTHVAKPLTWRDRCVYKCGPRGGTSGIPCTGYVDCEKLCTEREDCRGFYLRMRRGTGATCADGTVESADCARGLAMVAQAIDSELANPAGPYEYYYERNTYTSDKGLAFHSAGTYPVNEHTVSMFTYEQLACSTATIPDDAPAHAVHTTLASCQETEARHCAVDNDDRVHEASTIGNCKYLFARIGRNHPSVCKAMCLSSDACMAWTWKSERCVHHTGVGQLTNAGVPADLTVLEELGFDPGHVCEEVDHAFDTCIGQCVHIRNKLHHGWCAHKWVNCKAGKFADEQKFPEAQRGMSVCTGGFHPEDTTLDGEDIVQYATSGTDRTYRTHGGTAFLRSYGSKSQRNPLTIGNRIGAYTANQCGDIGAYEMERDMFDDWREWSKNELQTNVDARMSSITGTDELQQHNWKTRTFVGASMGSPKNKDGNAYASPLAGTTENVADGVEPLQFPKCQISESPTGRLYSFTRGKQCSNRLNSNMKAYYENSLATFQENVWTDRTDGAAGSPFTSVTMYGGNLETTFTDTLDTRDGMTAGLKLRGANAGHLLCFGRRVTQMGMALEGKGQSGQWHMTYTDDGTPELIDSHRVDAQCHSGWQLAEVADVAYERAYGDNEECYMMTAEMGNYIRDEEEGDTTTFSTLHEHPTGVVCASTSALNTTANLLVLKSGMSSNSAIVWNYGYFGHNKDPQGMKFSGANQTGMERYRTYPRPRGGAERNAALAFYVGVGWTDAKSHYWDDLTNVPQHITDFCNSLPTPPSENGASGNACHDGVKTYFQGHTEFTQNLRMLGLEGTAYNMGSCALLEADVPINPVSRASYGLCTDACADPLGPKSFMEKKDPVGAAAGLYSHLKNCCKFATWVGDKGTVPCRCLFFEATPDFDNAGGSGDCPGRTGKAARTDLEYDAAVRVRPGMNEPYGYDYDEEWEFSRTWMIYNSEQTKGSAMSPTFSRMSPTGYKDDTINYKNQCFEACKAVCAIGDGRRPFCKYCVFEGATYPSEDTGEYGTAPKCSLAKECAFAAGKMSYVAQFGSSTAASSILPETATLDGLEQSGALHPNSKGTMHPKVGYIQNAQRAHADVGDKRQSTTYFPRPGLLVADPYVLTCKLDFSRAVRYPTKLISTTAVQLVTLKQADYDELDSAFPTAATHNGHQCWKVAGQVCDTARSLNGEPYTNGYCSFVFYNQQGCHLLHTSALASGFRHSRGADDPSHVTSTNTDVLPSKHLNDLYQFTCVDGSDQFPQAWTTSALSHRNPIPEVDGPRWKELIATAPSGNTPYYRTAHLPASAGSTRADVNAVNAGFMCPVGVHVGVTTEPLTSVDTQKWHPLAQTTLMCPHDKPVRCSRLTVVSPVGGSCEYSSETGKQQHFWSGTRPPSVEAGGESMENWKSKLGNNALCHIYDFSCHSVEDDLATAVCGLTSDVEVPLGGTKCGNNTSDAMGFCGVNQSTATHLTPDDAYAHCEVWPTQGRSVCPPGFAFHKGTCSPVTHATKQTGLYRSDINAVLRSIEATTFAPRYEYYSSSNCESNDEVSTTRGTCVKKTCSHRREATCESQDVVESAIRIDYIGRDSSGKDMYTSQSEATAKCHEAGYDNLCTRPELEANAHRFTLDKQCQAAFLEDGTKAYFLTDAHCGASKGWNTWGASTAGAFCCTGTADGTARSCQWNGTSCIDQTWTTDVTIDSSRKWWPGFVVDSSSWAGTGPAYAKQFGKCDDTTDGCRGFSMCGKPTVDSTVCLNSANVVDTCCQRSGAEAGHIDGQCTVTPSTKCAGGGFLYSEEYSGAVWRAQHKSTLGNSSTHETCPSALPYPYASKTAKGINDRCCSVLPVQKFALGTTLGEVFTEEKSQAKCTSYANSDDYSTVTKARVKCEGMANCVAVSDEFKSVEYSYCDQYIWLTNICWPGSTKTAYDYPRSIRLCTGRNGAGTATHYVKDSAVGIYDIKEELCTSPATNAPCAQPPCEAHSSVVGHCPAGHYPYKSGTKCCSDVPHKPLVDGAKDGFINKHTYSTLELADAGCIAAGYDGLCPWGTVKAIGRSSVCEFGWMAGLSATAYRYVETTNPDNCNGVVGWSSTNGPVTEGSFPTSRRLVEDELIHRRHRASTNGARRQLGEALQAKNSPPPPPPPTPAPTPLPLSGAFCCGQAVETAALSHVTASECSGTSSDCTATSCVPAVCPAQYPHPADGIKPALIDLSTHGTHASAEAACIANGYTRLCSAGIVEQYISTGSCAMGWMLGPSGNFEKNRYVPASNPNCDTVGWHGSWWPGNSGMKAGAFCCGAKPMCCASKPLPFTYDGRSISVCDPAASIACTHPPCSPGTVAPEKKACNCNEKQCTDNTNSVSVETTRSLTGVGYHGESQELLLTLVDRRTGLGVRAEGCRGSAGRMQGQFYGTCGCTKPVSTDPYKHGGLLYRSTAADCAGKDDCAGEDGIHMYFAHKPAGSSDLVFVSTSFNKKKSHLLRYRCSMQTSCTPYLPRHGTDGFVVNPLGDVVVTGNDLECQMFVTPERAQHWCIGSGVTCLGLAWDGTSYCKIGRLHRLDAFANADQLWLKDAYIRTGCARATTWTTVEHAFALCIGAREGINLKEVECCGANGCGASIRCVLQAVESPVRYTVYDRKQSQNAHVYREAASDIQGVVAINPAYPAFEAKGPEAACTANNDCVGFKCTSSGECTLYKAGGTATVVKDMYFIKKAQHGVDMPEKCAQWNGATAGFNQPCLAGLAYFRTSAGLTKCQNKNRDEEGNAGPPTLKYPMAEIKEECGPYSTDDVWSELSRADLDVPAGIARCPKRLNCVHGTSVANSTGCTCRCDKYFAGALCDTCTSSNRKEDCRTCKDNYHVGFNNVCVCSAGFNITTACTGCLKSYTGSHCETSTCDYILQDTIGPQAYELNDIVVAHSNTAVLYEGIKNAGSGRVPHSMQNTFVKQDGTVYWLYGNTTGRVVVTDGYPAAVENAVHHTSGEWLYSIPERTRRVYTGADGTMECADPVPVGNLKSAERVCDRHGTCSKFTMNATHACLEMAGGRVASSTETQLETLLHSDIATDEDTWGFVCGYGTNIAGTEPRKGTATTPYTCAAACGTDTTCGSWHFTNRTCTSYSIAYLLNPSASYTMGTYEAAEYYVHPSTCLSGGLLGSGKMRNLPIKPSLAVPTASELLTPTPTWLRWSVVCAQGSNDPFILSEYRRHQWSGSPCTAHVQFTWMYSLPRGRPMDVGSVHHSWSRGTVRVDTGAFPLVAGSRDDCVQHCRDNQCTLWLHNGAQCALTTAIPADKNAACVDFTPLTWGGSIPSVPTTITTITVPGTDTLCTLVDGHTYGTDAICIGERRWTTAQAAGRLHVNAAVDRSTILLGKGTVAIPETAAVQASVGNENECCNMCQGYQAWRLAGAACYCYDGGEVVGNVDDCWVPHTMSPGDTCNTQMHMVWQGIKRVSGSNNCSPLPASADATATSCIDACMADAKCNIATFDTVPGRKTCQRYTCQTHSLAVGTTTHAWAKMGGCVQQGNECVYRPQSDATPTLCSANGAVRAYQANARLYYGDSADGNSVPLHANSTTCHNNFVPMAALPLGFVMQTVDTALLMNRFEHDVWPNTAGMFEMPLGMVDAVPRKAKTGIAREFKFPKGTSSRRRSIANAIGVSTNTRFGIDITQTIAISTEEQTCLQQARIATSMAGLATASHSQGRCNEYGCTAPIFRTSTLETLQAAYVQQLAACHARAWAVDSANPVGLLIYVQPPRGMESKVYQGLPTYWVPEATSSFPATFFGEETPPRAISYPTPAPAVFETNSPTPSPFADTPNVVCTAAQHCCFYKHSDTTVTAQFMSFADDTGSVYEITAHDTDGKTEDECMHLCAKLLLCRVMLYRQSACKMWSLPIEVPLGYGNTVEVQKPYYVSTVDGDCKPSTRITEGLQSEPGTTTFVKQDCCFHSIAS